LVPMMVDDGQFHLFDAWTLTKGHTASLFAVGLCLVLIVVVAEAILGALFIALCIAAINVSAGGLVNAAAMVRQQGPQSIAMHFVPWLVVVGSLAIPISGCAMAIFIAPWARAYRDIVPPGAPATAAPPATPPPVQPSPAVA